MLQCLDRDPKQRPSFDHVVELLREVLMPGEGAEAAVHLGARVFLEFDLPRIVEAMRDSAMLLASPPTAISVQRKCVEVIIRTTKKGHVN